MWTRAELKGRAKGVLGKYYWISFAVTLLIAALGGGGSAGVILAFFVTLPLQVGLCHFFLEARQGRADAVNLFEAFKTGNYLSIVGAMAWMVLFEFLWTLLFFIPGIIKYYAYSMVPYIMADNPKMDYRRALKLSMAMTKGQKWGMFVLDLSFLGWGILGVLCFGIGVLFLAPYIAATKAELYVALRASAIKSGIATAAELNQAA